MKQGIYSVTIKLNFPFYVTTVLLTVKVNKIVTSFGMYVSILTAFQGFNPFL